MCSNDKVSLDITVEEKEYLLLFLGRLKKKKYYN